jgi:hypothetical protein
MNPTSKLPLDTISEFKWWRLQKKSAYKLLKEIVFRWRGSSGRVAGRSGKWVVYPRETWSFWTGLSRNQTDRALKELVDVGLIERERHRFAGTEVRAYVRPTALAIKYVGKKGDAAYLGSPGEKSAEKKDAKPSEKTGEKSNEKSDYTSIPSVPPLTIKPKNTTEEVHVSQTEEGKGKAGETGEEFEEQLLKLNATKKAKDEKSYPELKGHHEKFVKHPSKIFPEWNSYSTKLKSQLYGQYVQYVENWTKGKKGTAYIEAAYYDTPEYMESAIAAYEKQKAAKLKES